MGQVRRLRVRRAHHNLVRVRLKVGVRVRVRARARVRVRVRAPVRVYRAQGWDLTLLYRQKPIARSGSAW